jgi:hypothetical protein
MIVEVFQTAFTPDNGSGELEPDFNPLIPIAMILKFILQILRQILNLQTENTNKILQTINSQRPPHAEEVWLHTEDVMKLLKKSERTVYNWRRSGELRHKMVGRTTYYLRSDIYRMLGKE